MAMDDRVLQALRGCALFETLDAPALRSFAKAARLQRFSRGQWLFRQGEASAGFFLILRGRIKVLRIAADGREQVLHVFGPGDVCGEVPVFQGRDFPAGAVATHLSEAVWLPRQPFFDVSVTHPEVLLRILAALCERLRMFTARIEDLSCREVPARLARHLADRAALRGRAVFELDGSKAELAASLGASPETLSRAFSTLQAAQMIRVRGRTIAVLDADALQRRADGMP